MILFLFRDDRSDFAAAPHARSPLNSPQKPSKAIKSSSEHVAHTSHSSGTSLTHSSVQYQLHRGSSVPSIPPNSGLVNTNNI